MPKVVYTAAKGLVQSAGSGFDVSTSGVEGGGFFAGFIPNSAQHTLTGAGVVSVSKYMTLLGAGTVTHTLAAGTVTGQLKKILSIHGDNKTVTVAGTGTASIAFTEVGDTAELMWTGAGWRTIATYNMAAGTADSPVAT